MKKIATIITATALCSVMALGIVGCSSGNDSDSGSSAAEQKQEVTYESILAEYTEKIEAATPGLVEEYNAEAAEHKGDVAALAEISNQKVSELAAISTQGIEEMAQLALEKNQVESDYMEWSTKLTNVYTAEAQKITDAYMASATSL